ncbi:MAG: 6-carboxytetrahydropterin synthase [Bacteroidetes bacterium]|nr:MAG: 6-carboxytetrahydropterin synthase [Bacteroidota bacterium]
MRVTIGRKAHFNAAHRLYNPNWTDEQNAAFYGKCNLPNYHGHNYKLEVKVKGEVDQETGYLLDLKWLSQIIKEEVEEPFDHRNLNLDTPEFRNLIPSAENIAGVIWRKIQARLPKEKNLDLMIVLYETERNFVEYSGE